MLHLTTRTSPAALAAPQLPAQSMPWSMAKYTTTQPFARTWKWRSTTPLIRPRTPNLFSLCTNTMVSASPPTFAVSTVSVSTMPNESSSSPSATGTASSPYSGAYSHRPPSLVLDGRAPALLQPNSGSPPNKKPSSAMAGNPNGIWSPSAPVPFRSALPPSSAPSKKSHRATSSSSATSNPNQSTPSPTGTPPPMPTNPSPTHAVTPK